VSGGGGHFLEVVVARHRRYQRFLVGKLLTADRARSPQHIAIPTLKPTRRGALAAAHLELEIAIAGPHRTSETAMVARESFAEFMREQFAQIGRLTLRRMSARRGVRRRRDDSLVTENTL